jgi:ABC-2 type transport system permease protein
MYSLFKKEIAAFFCSATGYLVVSVFLVATGLFLWVIPGDLNIIYSGYASLEPLFVISPWILLFLVPAVSMRLIAEEKKSGTMELLLIRPLSTLQIVGAKYLAGLTLVGISILPTIVYAVIIYLMGNPVGNIDLGGTFGSYIGLIMLAAVYMAIGTFASSTTDNQIVAFMIGVALCFVFYIGFDSLASIPAMRPVQHELALFGIDSHYSSISRGVVDSRDLIYFVSVVLLFIGLTVLVVMRRCGRRSLKVVAMLAAVVAVNALLQSFYFRLDLTSEKRFTLSDLTQRYMASTEKQVLVKVYLTGDLNPGFNRLSKSTMEMLDELSVASSADLEAYVADPSTMSKDELKELNDNLAEFGLGGVPVFETKEDGQKTRTVVYPYAKIQIGDVMTWVNLLDNVPGLSSDENLNRSVETLEYKLVDAMRRLTTEEKPRVAFLEGHGELSEIDVVEATDALSYHFAVDRGAIGDDARILDPYKVVIIAKPAEKFTEKEKFVLDQYLMRGGRTLWLVDAVNMTLDTLRNSPHTIGLLSDFNIEDMLFIYGVRINPEVVEDISCGMVPISVAQGDGTKIVPMPWRFSPLLSVNMHSPITRNVSLVKGDFASYIDTVGENLKLQRTPLLRTSKYTKVNPTPVFATLANIHEKPQRSEFTRQHLDVAMLQEGEFASAFSHRRVPQGIKNAGTILKTSVPTKMIVVADGDIIRNDVRFRNSANPNIVPLGYDEMTRQTFGNKDFIVNAVQYLADDDGWMTLRNRTFTLRLLDKEKIGAGTTQWKVCAMAIPLMIVVLFGIIVVIIRRIKFGK